MCLSRVNSFEELQSLYSNLKGLLDIKKGKQNKDGKFNISICGGTGCQASQSEKIKEELERFAKLYGVDDRVSISITGCFGFCEKGPIVKISPDHTFYIKIKPENAERIIKEHIVEGKLIEDFLYTNPAIHPYAPNSNAIIIALIIGGIPKSILLKSGVITPTKNPYGAPTSSTV